MFSDLSAMSQCGQWEMSSLSFCYNLPAMFQNYWLHWLHFTKLIKKVNQTCFHQLSWSESRQQAVRLLGDVYKLAVSNTLMLLGSKMNGFFCKEKLMSWWVTCWLWQLFIERARTTWSERAKCKSTIDKFMETHLYSHFSHTQSSSPLSA